MGLKVDKSKWWFNQLDVGDKFKLLNSDEVCTKISKRKYKDSKGESHLIPTVAYGCIYLVDETVELEKV